MTRKFAMQLFSGSTVCPVGFFGGVKAAKVMMHAVCGDAGDVLTNVRRPAELDALKSGDVDFWLTAIKSVLRLRGFAQVLYAIVVPHGVAVVKTLPPPSKNMEPRQAMSVEVMAANADRAVSANGINDAGDVSGIARVYINRNISANFPAKDARSLVIRKRGSDIGMGEALAARDAACNFLGSHCDPLRSLVRSRASVASAVFGFAIMPQTPREA